MYIHHNTAAFDTVDHDLLMLRLERQFGLRGVVLQWFSSCLVWMEIDKLRTTVFKPSTNAVVERLHRTLNSMLAKSISESQRDWDERLPLVLAAYRATAHSSTGFTPNRLFLGREVRLPVDLIMGLPVEEGPASQTTDEYVANLQQQSIAAFELARKYLRANAERRKAFYDIRSKEVKFSAGDWVWYLYPRRYQGKSIKWQKSYTGPYLIVRVIQPVNCVLQRSAKSKPFVAHFDKLKKCHGQTPSSWLSGETSTHERTDEPDHVDRNAVASEMTSRSREGSTTLSDLLRYDNDREPEVTHTYNIRRRSSSVQTADKDRHQRRVSPHARRPSSHALHRVISSSANDRRHALA